MLVVVGSMPRFGSLSFFINLWCSFCLPLCIFYAEEEVEPLSFAPLRNLVTPKLLNIPQLSSCTIRGWAIWGPFPSTAVITEASQKLNRFVWFQKECSNQTVRRKHTTDLVTASPIRQQSVRRSSHMLNCSDIP